MKKIQLVASALLLLTATTSLTQFVEPANAEQNFFYLVSKHSDKCAQVNGASLENGIPITLWDCVNQNNVKWRRVDAGNGDFYLVAKHSDKCLHVQGGGLENDAQITRTLA